MDEEGIKNAFLKVKKDIERLKIDISSSNQAIQEQNNLITSLKSKISELKDLLLELNTQSSTGNEGVQSINHSTINQSITNQSQTIQQSINHKSISGQISTFTKLHELNEELSKTFQSLTNQEFLVFLTIYQLEDDHEKVSYNEVATKNSLTSGCIRGYVSTLIQKGAPILKTRLKNRQTSLTIDKSFRLLGLKDKLINLYYQQDPNQTTFLTNFNSHF